MKKFLAFSLSDVVFIMLINVKMPTVVRILIFISWINFVTAELSVKSFITSGPGLLTLQNTKPVQIAQLSHFVHFTRLNLFNVNYVVFSKRR